MKNKIAIHSLNSRLKRSAALLMLVGVAVFGSIISSCTDRGNPTFRTEPPEGISTWTRNHFFIETGFSQFSDLVTTSLNIYTPPGYDDKGFNRPYPTLFMLSPFRGDQFFYLHNNLQTVMNRMIASGEIEPMIVVTINGTSNPFGGSFYSNYITNGLWENLISQSLVAFIDTQFNTFGTITSDPVERKNLRAISGYEMAGYGAMRAMISPDPFTASAGATNFGSVSAISAPLYFSDNTYGFPRLFTQALGEWGSYSEIDSSSFAPATSFLIAAAIGFSPEDTAYSIGLDSVGNVVVDSINKIYDSTVIDTMINTTVAPPETTFAYNPPTDITFPAFPDNITGEDATLRMFLPFDSTGAPYNLIWDLWKRHDMANVVDSLGSTMLSELSGNVMIMATQDAKFNHFDQDTMFANKLQSLPTPVTTIFEEYSGYDGFADEGGSHFIFEVLPSILKFHSDRMHPFVPADLQVKNYQAKY